MRTEKHGMHACKGQIPAPKRTQVCAENADRASAETKAMLLKTGIAYPPKMK